MNLLGVIIGVLGLALSLLLFWIQKIRKYPSQLSYSLLACSRIVGKSDSEFQDVSLHYKEYDVKNDLFYVKSLIFNRRSSDVCASEKDSPISLKLSGDSKWLDIRINKESLNVGSTVVINREMKQTASLSFPLLKKGEYIVIEGLIESSSSLVDNEEPIISIDHRIAELDKFDYIPMVTDRRYKRSMKTLKTYGIAVGVLLVALVFDFVFPEKSAIRYRRIGDENNPVEYYAGVDKNNQIILNENRSFSLYIKSGKIFSKEEFESHYRPHYCFHHSFRYYYSLVMIVLFVFLYGIMLSDISKDFYRYRLLSKYNK